MQRSGHAHYRWLPFPERIETFWRSMAGSQLVLRERDCGSAA
jgi:hypothetical protein